MPNPYDHDDGCPICGARECEKDSGVVCSICGEKCCHPDKKEWLDKEFAICVGIQARWSPLGSGVSGD